MSSRFLSRDILLRIEIESESTCFNINLQIIQKYIKIFFTDASKTSRGGRQFVNKGTMLRYSLSITE